MKPTQIALALLAMVGMTACTASRPQGIAAMQIEPVYAIRHGAVSAAAYYQLGRYQQGQGRLAEAEEAYLKAVTVDEAYVDGYNALGSLYAERGELKRSAEMFEKVVSLAPAAAYLHNNLGYAYYLQGLQGDAYRSVYKALTLDSGFERAWENLEKIAAAGPDPVLMQALKQRQIAVLPSSLGKQMQLAKVELPRPENQEVGLGSENVPRQMQDVALESRGLALQQETHLPKSISATRLVTNIHGLASDRRFGEAMPGQTAASVAKTFPTANLVAVSAKQVPSTRVDSEVVPGSNQSVRPVAVDQGGGVPAELSLVRFEVSNGNGIAGLARRVGATLRKDGFVVSRITNHVSYAMATTVVQYQPGFEGAARAFVAKYNLNARLVSAVAQRHNVDVRVVLGRGAPLYGVVAI